MHGYQPQKISFIESSYARRTHVRNPNANNLNRIHIGRTFGTLCPVCNEVEERGAGSCIMGTNCRFIKSHVRLAI